MRALLSVSDKTGIDSLAHALHERGVEIISTGGTARAIGEAGIPVVSVSEVTAFPEMLDGRVKTLHPSIHGGLLADLDDPTHQRQLADSSIAPISVLVVNLYPFERTVTSPSATAADIVENIDIGGPAMVRAGAKNFAHVFVVTSPDDYPVLLEALDAPERNHLALRRRLAADAFAHVSIYDSLVAGWMRSSDDPFPEELTIGLRRAAHLRYGENPHQLAAAYHRLLPRSGPRGVLEARQLQGKALSFNNLLDADAALQAVRAIESPDPVVSVIKHMIPCGLASRGTLEAAFTAAREGDPISAFGGIIACSHDIDAPTARAASETFLEVILAPGFTPGALETFEAKRNLRLLELPDLNEAGPASLDLRPITGGLLVQEEDRANHGESDWQVVTERQPTSDELSDLRFAWAAVRLVKSNAIVFVKGRAVIGVGAGQPNRLESVAIAARKAGERAVGAAMASDAFFPFPDGIEEAIRAGVTAVIQPGGSRRDDDVIAAANEAGIAMVCTGRRHFRH
ncbi:MAG: bifunctional phosphoribosylaminoimidazolecarboxamide formyltransferase/IMP cyclohydrolase [Gemmatimonadetes bacterium]|nr:bifunctional phosphoribosylaminoimidazolecarboxamide formyltransferase/IMP cyclohydrolase [Gemmatimonadota bacterium]